MNRPTPVLDLVGAFLLTGSAVAAVAVPARRVVDAVSDHHPEPHVIAPATGTYCLILPPVPDYLMPQFADDLDALAENLTSLATIARRKIAESDQ